MCATPMSFNLFFHTLNIHNKKEFLMLKVIINMNTYSFKYELYLNDYCMKRCVKIVSKNFEAKIS